MSTNDIDMHTSSIPPKYEEVTSDINPIMFQLQLAQKKIKDNINTRIKKTLIERFIPSETDLLTYANENYTLNELCLIQLVKTSSDITNKQLGYYCPTEKRNINSMKIMNINTKYIFIISDSDTIDHENKHIPGKYILNILEEKCKELKYPYQRSEDKIIITW